MARRIIQTGVTTVSGASRTWVVRCKGTERRLAVLPLYDNSIESIFDLQISSIASAFKYLAAISHPRPILGFNMSCTMYAR